MEENKNVVEVENTEQVSTWERTSVPNPSVMSKVKSGVKKHWKKAVAFVGVAALGFVLGKGIGGSEDDSCDCEAEATDDEDYEFVVVPEEQE